MGGGFSIQRVNSSPYSIIAILTTFKTLICLASHCSSIQMYFIWWQTLNTCLKVIQPCMLNSTEHETNPAHKCLKMLTIVGM